MKKLTLSIAFALAGLTAYAQPVTSNYILPYNTQTKILRIQNLYQGLPTDSILVVTNQNRWLGRIALSDYTGFDARYKAISYVPAWSDITNKPTSFTPTAHTHTQSQVIGLSSKLDSVNTVLNGKQAAGSYLTSITSAQVSSALGFTPTSRASNDLLYKPIGYTPSWGEIAGKPTFSAVAISGNYNDLINKPSVVSAKRQETYSGVTNATGVYVVVFATPFATIPNVQASIPNQANTSQMIRVSNITTTGFTVNVYQRAAVTLLGLEVLLAATTNVASVAIDALVTEK